MSRSSRLGHAESGAVPHPAPSLAAIAEAAALAEAGERRFPGIPRRVDQDRHRRPGLAPARREIEARGFGVAVGHDERRAREIIGAAAARDQHQHRVRIERGELGLEIGARGLLVAPALLRERGEHRPAERSGPARGRAEGGHLRQRRGGGHEHSRTRAVRDDRGHSARAALLRIHVAQTRRQPGERDGGEQLPARRLDRQRAAARHPPRQRLCGGAAQLDPVAADRRVEHRLAVDRDRRGAAIGAGRGERERHRAGRACHSPKQHLRRLAPAPFLGGQRGRFAALHIVTGNRPVAEHLLRRRLGSGGGEEQCEDRHAHILAECGARR